MDTLGKTFTNNKKRVVNNAKVPRSIDISTALGTYIPHPSGRYCRDNYVATIRKRSVYIPMLMAMDSTSMGTKDVLKLLKAQSSGAMAQKAIISQYNGA